MNNTIFEALSSYIRDINSKYRDFVDVVEEDFLGGVGTNNNEFDIFNVPEVVWSNNKATITFGDEYNNEGELYLLQNTHSFKEFIESGLSEVFDSALSDVIKFKNDISYKDVVIRIDQIITPDQ